MEWVTGALAAEDYEVGRQIVQRGVAAVYLIAFASALNQFPALLGERGLLPVPEYLRRAGDRAGPTLFRRGYTDRRLRAVAWTGIVLSALFLPPLLGSGWRAAWVALGAASLLSLGLALGTLARLPERTPAPPSGAARMPLTPLAWSFAAYTCFGVGYIAYMTFIVAFLRSVGAGDLVTPFWALLGACVVANPYVWARPSAHAPGARDPEGELLCDADLAVLASAPSPSGS